MSGHPYNENIIFQILYFCVLVHPNYEKNVEIHALDVVGFGISNIQYLQINTK